MQKTNGRGNTVTTQIKLTNGDAENKREREYSVTTQIKLTDLQSRKPKRKEGILCHDTDIMLTSCDPGNQTGRRGKTTSLHRHDSIAKMLISYGVSGQIQRKRKIKSLQNASFILLWQITVWAHRTMTSCDAGCWRGSGGRRHCISCILLLWSCLLCPIGVSPPPPQDQVHTYTILIILILTNTNSTDQLRCG